MVWDLIDKLRRITGWDEPPSHPQRFATLDVHPLEERVVPVTAISVPPPEQAPEKIIVVDGISLPVAAKVATPQVENPPFFAPPIQDMRGVVVSATVSSPVRTDLLGRGGSHGEQPETQDPLDEQEEPTRSAAPLAEATPAEEQPETTSGATPIETKDIAEQP